MGLKSMWTLGLAIWKLVLKTLCEGRFESNSVVLLIQLLLLKKKKKKEEKAGEIKVQLFNQFTVE